MNSSRDPRCFRFEPLHSRRDFLLKSGAGFGALALSHLLEGNRLFAAPTKNIVSPLAPRPSPFRPRARNVIFLFMEGGPSHLDTFDPKEALKKNAGQPLPPSFTKGLITAMGEYNSPIFPDKREWKQCGQGGLWISDWCRHVAG